MFETLLASAVRFDRRPIPVMAAAGVHLLLLGTALTNSHLDPIRIPIVPDTAVFFLPPTSPVIGQTPATPAAPGALTIEAAPAIDPPGLLASDPGVAVVLPGPVGVPATGVAGIPLHSPSFHAISALISGAEVEEAASVLTPGRLRYPPALEAAGLAGRVELAFVVDTTGRVEPGSFVVLAATDPEFEAAARAAVLDTRFRPARAHGMPVRQLVRQSLVFKVPAR